MLSPAHDEWAAAWVCRGVEAGGGPTSEGTIPVAPVLPATAFVGPTHGRIERSFRTLHGSTGSFKGPVRHKLCMCTMFWNHGLHALP